MKKLNGISIRGSDILKNKILNALPFNLTVSQNDAIHEITKDMASGRRMLRLLQGDVGSGKTIVALISALNVIESGYQVAFMAPTEILSKQHYLLAKKIFPENIKIDLITSKTDLKSIFMFSGNIF